MSSSKQMVDDAACCVDYQVIPRKNYNGEIGKLGGMNGEIGWDYRKLPLAAEKRGN